MRINFFLVLTNVLLKDQFCSASSILLQSKICSPGEFKCNDGFCVLADWICDGSEDCMDGEDEFNCHQIEAAPSELFHKAPVVDPEQSHQNSSIQISYNKAKVTENTKMENSTRHERNLPCLDNNCQINSTSNIALPVISNYINAYDELNLVELTDQISERNYSYVDIVKSVNRSKENENKSNEMIQTNYLVIQPSNYSLQSNNFIHSGNNANNQSKLSQSNSNALKEIKSEITSIRRDIRGLGEKIWKSKLPQIELLIKVARQLEMLQRFNNRTKAKDCKTPSSQQLIKKLTCPSNFQFISGKCIYIQIYPPVNFDEAKIICQNQNGSLVFIQAADYLREILLQMNFDRQSIYSYWIAKTNFGSALVSVGDTQTLHIYSRKNKSSMLLRNCPFLDGRQQSMINFDNCGKPKGFICEHNMLHIRSK